MSETRRLRCSYALLAAAIFVSILIATPAWSTQSAPQLAGPTSGSDSTAYDLLVGFFAFDGDQFDVAARHFFRAAQAQPNAQIAEYAMRSALLANDDKTAIAAGQLWSRLDSDNPVSIEFRVRAYSRLAAIEPAIDELDRLRHLILAMVIMVTCRYCRCYLRIPLTLLRSS